MSAPLVPGCRTVTLPVSREDWERRRFWLPYGLWTCGDGREVLFNRAYRPLWSRCDGQTSRANPDEFVLGIESQVWFFEDGDSPLHKTSRDPRQLAKQQAALMRAVAALDLWGCPYGG